MSLGDFTQPLKDLFGHENYLEVRAVVLEILNNLAWILSPGNRMFWPFLISFIIIGLLAYKNFPEKKGFLSFLVPKKVFLHPDSIRGYIFVAINSILAALVQFGSLILSTLLVTDLTRTGLETWLGTTSAGTSPSLFVTALFSLTMLIAADFALWLSHALFHKVPVLWEFHKVHHCPEYLTPVTDRQIHPVEEIIRGAVISMAIGPVIGVGQYLYGEPPVVLTILGVSIFKFGFELFGNFRHSHIWIAFPRRLSYILSSPAMHHIHHSKAKEHWDKNYAVMFSFWDWAFGTLYIPKGRETVSMGVYGDDRDELNSVLKLYFRPFVRAFRHIPGVKGHKELVLKLRDARDTVDSPTSS